MKPVVWFRGILVYEISSLLVPQRIVFNLATSAVCFRSSQLFAVALMWRNTWITRHSIKPIISLSMWIRNSLFFPLYPLCWFPVATQYSAVLSVRGELLCGLNESVDGSSGSAQWSSVCEICCEGIHMLSIQKVSLWLHGLKACCQATRHREHPQMVYLISKVQPVQQLCLLYWFTLLLEP